MLKRCELRERQEKRRRQKKSDRRLAKQPSELKRLITALILSRRPDYDAERISHEFGWPIADVERWLAVGKELR